MNNRSDKIKKYIKVILLLAICCQSAWSEKTIARSVQKPTSVFPLLLDQEKADFFKKYDVYYFNGNGDFVKNGQKIEKGGEKFSPDILYSDGAYLSSYSEIYDKTMKEKKSFSEIEDTSSSLNDYKLFFNGNIYESDGPADNVLRDGNYIFYLRGLGKKYIKEENGNRCVKIGLYANDDKVDESDLTDIEIKTGTRLSIAPLFVKNGILYYEKAVNEKYSFYTYDPINKKVDLFKPELFGNNENEPLGIFDNGDVIFDNKSGVYKNNLQTKFIDVGEFYCKGITVGNSYYWSTIGHDQKKDGGGYGLLKDNLLVAKIKTGTHGRMIDTDKCYCHFGNYIYGYQTLMYCINKEGTIVCLDSKIKENKGNKPVRSGPEVESNIEYFINKDVIDFSPYWKTGERFDGINSLSFVFNENGAVEYLLVNAYDNQLSVINIYLAPYLGNGKIGTPQMLISNASLFGVIRKPAIK